MFKPFVSCLNFRFMFELFKTDPYTRARLGRLTTPHGAIDTPTFMPVGTQGSVKALDPRELREMNTQIILGNTYHLHIRPGLDIISAAGGLHRFINWPHPILTDSGGFQVFSLAKIRKIKPHGVEFRSHLDGSLLFLGPKEAMQIQRVLGSDIAMVFDECPPHDSPMREMRAAVERTVRWARECREQPRAPGQMVFGIVQGGSDAALREECAKELVAMDFDGYAIGGVSVGEPEPEMMKAVEFAEPFLPREQGALRHGPRGTAGANGGTGWRAAWIYLIVYCPRVSPATAPRSPPKAPSASRPDSTNPISAPLRRAANVMPAEISPVPTCGIC